MSEPQHPQPHDTDTNASRPGPTAVPHPAVQPVLDSLPAVGARLAQLRTAKGWSIDDVSARLKVSAPKLVALESGDVSQLPDTTFALGVIRSYAKMLGVDPTPFTQVLRREKGSPTPNLSMPASSGRDLPRGRVSLSLGNSSPKRRSWLWGVAAVIVGVVAIGMWHTNGGDSSAWLARLKATANGAAGATGGASGTVAQGETAASGATDTAAASAAAPATALAASSGVVSTADNGGASQPQMQMPTPLAPGNDQAPAPAVASAAQAAPAGQQPAQAAAKPGASATAVAGASAPATPADGSGSVIAIRVNADSWFNVRQKDGKEVFSGLLKAGETKQVQGEPPFKVTVGNKAGLESMSLDGTPVDAAKYSGAHSNVARFSLP